MLVHDGVARGDLGEHAAATLWYPFWDAGLVLGHAVRTPKEALALARDDVDVLTGLLDLRLVLGDEALATDLLDDARRLAARRSRMLVSTLAARAAARDERPGPIAEMLEPNLKEGAGGLRDVHSLEWAGWALGHPGGLGALVEAGYLQTSDPAVIGLARERLLDARVALHRVTGGSSDVLTLQEQDAVAAIVGASDADALVRELSAAARAVTWISGDAWRRLSGTKRRRRARAGVVTVPPDVPLDATMILRAGSDAARRGVPIDRKSLERMRGLDEVTWTSDARDSFVSLLRAGRGAVPVFEALDQVGVLVALLPEWEHVRARPQRNAYHRFTVDRHLLEAVAECAALLDDRGFDGDVARRCRPALLLLGALFHDIGKGLPGDHSVVGADLARGALLRLGFDAHGAEIVAWLVRHHLLLAETATRRDLGDHETITRVGRNVRDTERLDLLYALTVGDSRATGPAAWSRAKAALLRQLFVETDTLLEQGVVAGSQGDERRAALERHRDLLAGRELALEWTAGDEGTLECVVVAPDRTGLLATVTGVLALHGYDIQAASVYGDDDTGMALEVYRGHDRFGRLDDAGRAAVAADVRAAIEGRFPLRARLEERIRRYARSDRGDDGSVRIAFDLEASSAATVVEVHAPDAVGLLARIAAVFADFDLDVSAALVSTLGERVVDVFYVRDAHGAKPSEPLALERLRATLVARLTADSLLT